MSVVFSEVLRNVPESLYVNKKTVVLSYENLLLPSSSICDGILFRNYALSLKLHAQVNFQDITKMQHSSLKPLAFLFNIINMMVRYNSKYYTFKNKHFLTLFLNLKQFIIFYEYTLTLIQSIFAL